MSRTTRKTRVMVVDDAVVARLLVTEALMADPDLELAGTAYDGRMALDTLDQVAPDVVVLDVEMPVLDGLSTLKELRSRHPSLPVVMFSTLTSRGAQTTLDALALGASDYVAKPSAGNRDESVRVLRQELLPRLKALTSTGGGASAGVPAPRRTAARTSAPSLAEVVVVGGSTGGPNALADLLPALPRDLRAPVVVAQQMPAVLTRLLGERLAAASTLRVAEARGGELLTPGTVWLAEGGNDLTVVRDGRGARLVSQPAAGECTPSIDVLFRSAAEAFGRAALGLVLTGMGPDALEGCRALQQAGGQVLVQDERSAVVWGLGRAVVDAGLADAVVPLSGLAEELVARTGSRTRVPTI